MTATREQIVSEWPTYRAKPCKIRARLHDITTREEIIAATGAVHAGVDEDGAEYERANLRIKTLEGDMECPPGYFVVCGTEGEFYPVKPSVFERKYEFDAPAAVSSLPEPGVAQEGGDVQVDARTPLPWEWIADDGSMISLGTVGDADGLGHVLSCHVCGACKESGNRCLLPNKRNTDYIVTACNAYPALKADAARLRAENDRLRKALAPLLALAKEYVAADGGCDHSVGICWCGVIRDIEQAEAAIAQGEVNHGC